jgi:uncharacterized membrane protein
MSKTRNRQVRAGGKTGGQQSAGRQASARPNTQTVDKRQSASTRARPAAPAGGRAATGQSAAGRSAGPAGGKAVRPQPGASGREPAAGRAAIPPAPRWLIVATLVLSVIGLGISVYLTIEHVTGSIPICSSKGIVNCAAVTTSAESKVFGIFPVSELGLAFYVFMVAVNSPWGWRMKHPAVRWLRLASVIVGIGFVLYLVYAELIQIGNICLWCTGVHIVTFFLFALIVFDSVFRQAPVSPVAQASAKKMKG